MVRLMQIAEPLVGLDSKPQQNAEEEFNSLDFRRSVLDADL